MNIFAPFNKVEDQDDGTIRVWGIASSEDRDSDGEVVKADAIRDAIPSYMRDSGLGALREMHQPIAAGKVDEMIVGDDNITRISAHVVDPITIKKIKTKVLRGFSIGGRVLKRNPMDPREITQCDVVEISAVDRSSNPSAVLQLWKADMTQSILEPLSKAAEAMIADPLKLTGPVYAHLVFGFKDGEAQDMKVAAGTIEFEKGDPIRTDEFDFALEEFFTKRKFTAEERRSAAKSGAAMRSGAYPIENEEDLHNAIRAIGRGKGSHAAIKAHIRRRAKALGLESKLPESWTKMTKGMDSVAHMANILSSVDCLLSNSEWEQMREGDSKEQVDAIKTWLKAGAKLLIEIVDEEARELARMDDGEEFDVLKAAGWFAGHIAKVRQTLRPPVGAKVVFEGVDIGKRSSTAVVKSLMPAAIEVTHDDGEMHQYLWPGLEAQLDGDKWKILGKRGARHSGTDMEHIQGAHDHLAKLGAVCAMEKSHADAARIGQTVMALPDDMRAAVSALAKVSIPAGAPPAAVASNDGVKAAEAAEAARTADLAKAAAAASAAPAPADLSAAIGVKFNELSAKWDAAMDGVKKMVNDAVAPLAADIQKLKAEPEPVRGVLRRPTEAAIAISKAEDVGGAARGVVPNAGEGVTDPMELLKRQFADGPDFNDPRYAFLKPARLIESDITKVQQ